MRSAEQPLHEQPIQTRLRDPSLAGGQFLVGGQWRGVGEGGSFRVRNPATGESLGSVAAGREEETEAAVRAAQEAWPAWRALTPEARGAVLRKWGELIRSAKEDLALIMTLEQGKPLFEARGEIDYAASF